MDSARAFALEKPSTWPRRPLLAGIVNVTPDSFSDGNSYFRWEKAVERGLALLADGADLLDLGAESSRPNAAPVSEDEELRRLLPVLRALSGETRRPISVDTRKPGIAAAALENGARWINDIGGLRDPEMLRVLADSNAGVVIMHMQGEPATMQERPRYDDVVEEVCAWLGAQAEQARNAGLDAERIWIDPGIGFGKSLEHNLELLRALDRIGRLGYPVMLGASRKSFIGQLSDDPVEERLAGGLAAAEAATHLPHAVLRTHDVRATRQYLLVRRSIQSGDAERWEDL